MVAAERGPASDPALPDGRLVLRGHETDIAGLPPLAIQTPNCRSHLVEAFVVGHPNAGRISGAHEKTLMPSAHRLSLTERLVLASLAQRYLRQEAYPQPVSWKQVAEDLNRCQPRARTWVAKTAENTVAAIRKRLAGGVRPIPGLLREEGIGEPVGFILSHNLILALLKDATLTPADLILLEEESWNDWAWGAAFDIICSTRWTAALSPIAAWTVFCQRAPSRTAARTRLSMSTWGPNWLAMPVSHAPASTAAAMSPSSAFCFPTANTAVDQWRPKSPN